MAARIMVVEDDADLLLALALRLKSAGHEVLNAMDGASAEAVARRERPDAIIMDIGIPHHDGHAVAEALAQHPETRSIPIIFLTARSEVEDRLKAAKEGAAGYIVKPVRADELFRVINSVLAFKLGNGSTTAH